MAVLDVPSLDFDQLIGLEWLAVNRIGGYASSTPIGLNTRKYHGLLVASMAPPVRRMVLLSRVEETVTVRGKSYPLACSEYPLAIHPDGYRRLRKFSNDPFPRWAYQDDGFTLEKSLRLVRGANTVVLSYTMLAGAAPAILSLRPMLALRGIHELGLQSNAKLDAVTRSPGHHCIPATSRTPEIFFAHEGEFESAGCWYLSTIYRRESERGYSGLEDLWSPGIVRWSLVPGQTVHFVCSADPIELPQVLDQLDHQHESIVDPIRWDQADPALASLLQAAEQYMLEPGATSPAVGSSFPWCPPNARDLLIGFGGLYLVTGRFDQARHLLRALADDLRDGLIPTIYPEDGGDPEYCGADTSLWFIDAVHQFLRYTGDTTSVREHLFDTVVRIIRCYQAGTKLGISLDSDGLVSSAEPGRATSWMDARIGSWAITPRQGKPVELNALWYNALCVAASLCERFNRSVWAGEFARLAESVRNAFNRLFWSEQDACCYDVLGDRDADRSIRPNQLLAVSLSYPVLARERHAAVLDRVSADLLTPLGVRTLAPGDPSYQGKYRGDVVQRDRAYHQGCAFPWLLGPLASAIVKVRGRTDAARRQAATVLSGCLRFVQTDGVGQLCELFDGDPPHAPGGAIASARSVGTVLQAYVEEALGCTPQPAPTDIPTDPARPIVGGPASL